eukprot:645725_1
MAHHGGRRHGGGHHGGGHHGGGHHGGHHPPPRHGGHHGPVHHPPPHQGPRHHPPPHHGPRHHPRPHGHHRPLFRFRFGGHHGPRRAPWRHHGGHPGPAVRCCNCIIYTLQLMFCCGLCWLCRCGCYEDDAPDNPPPNAQPNDNKGGYQSLPQSEAQDDPSAPLIVKQEIEQNEGAAPQDIAVTMQ